MPIDLVISANSLSHVCKMFNLYYIISMGPCSCSVLRFYLQDTVNSNPTESKVKMKNDLVRDLPRGTWFTVNIENVQKKTTS